MNTVITALVFILILSGLVIIHELGHFAVSRWVKIRVEQFSIFFPPHIWKKKLGETEYAIGVVPLGGYVKLFGEESGVKSKGSFESATVWQRMGVIVAGVIMNFVMAIALLWLGFTIGMPPVVSTPSQLGISSPTQVIVTLVEPGSAAEKVGVKTGDTMVGFDNAQALEDFTTAHRGQTVAFSVRHDGTDRTVETTLAAQGAAFGIGLAETTIIKVSPIVAVRLAVVESWRIVEAMWNFLGQLFTGLFVHAKLSSEVTGPVGIFMYTGQALQLGFAYVVQLAAMISVNLALVNLLPFPGLDGGRALFVLLEGVFKRKVVQERYEALFHAIGFWLLMIFFIVVTIRDIGRFL